MDSPTRDKVDTKGRDDGPALYGIVPDITRTPTKPSKLIRILLFLLGLAGTLYFQLLPTPIFDIISGLNIITSPPISKPRSSNAPTPKYRTSTPAPDLDEIYPLRPASPWDISTDFPYPRTLEYDVDEGTWLRLDVHPLSGDVVFDMAGDIWCLPAGEAYVGLEGEGDNAYKSKARARPILLGVPYDSDPHFSPAGDKLVFRSDAELGVENIWVVPWTAGGCEAMDLRPGAGAGGPMDDVELIQALEVKSVEDALLIRGVKETPGRRRRRLMREGRWRAQRVTNETYHWVSDARFHPSGSKVIATKWYTSSRSLGAGEGWEYPIPSLSDHKVVTGSGKRLIERTLPSGWGAEQYNEQQIGPEQFIWHGEDSLIFAKNVADEDSGVFKYAKDVHKGIYAIFTRNLTTGQTERIVNSNPGGASRPELSRDGKTLAYVTRVRDKQALVLKDLHSGTIHHAWYGLTYDLSAISAPMGTYPSFAFTPTDDAVIIWAAGQIYHVPLSVNGRGEKVALGTPRPIRFTAHIEKRLAETRRSKTDLVGLETQDTQRVHAFTELRVDGEGKKAVFQAAGVSYVQMVGKKTSHPRKVPVKHADATYYSPTFVYGADDLVLHGRWSNLNFTTFELANLTSKTAYELEGLPFGRYYSPILCECSGSQRRVAFIKTGGDLLTGDIVATARTGLYIGEITIPSLWNPTHGNIAIQNLRFVSSEINTYDFRSMRFIDGGKKLLVQHSSKVFIIDLGAGSNKFGGYPHHTLATGKTSVELAISPRLSKSGTVVPDKVAFVDFYHVYLASGNNIGKDEAVWSKPANSTKGLARLSLDGGHDITWSRDGKKIFWLLGPFLHSLEISKLKDCSTAIKKDQSTFGISCVRKLVEYQEIIVHHSTDISRLKQQSAALAVGSNLANADALVIINARILTMESRPKSSLIPDGVLISRGGVIESVGDVHSVMIPDGATVIDARGGYVVPGFIDVHAHWGGFGTRYPATSWEHETFLAYGVTTLHNPSADNVQGFVERSRLESGQLVGPRIFQVGNIIYGAGQAGIHQDIIDMDEAYSALIRIKAEGGPASFSYKNYNLPSRASRQRLLLVAHNLSMLCVPEGGMNHDWDLTYIIDGMTTVEHALPVSVLYNDILTLYALSGTGSTPTHIVNYGGAFGEQFVWATEDVPNDPKLRRFTRHDMLEVLSESTARPRNSYALFNTSASVAKMVDKGLLAHIGAHGEPPLGLNYHAEMFFTQQGGLSNYEVLRAATSSAAITLGLDDSIGTLSPGKLADFLVYSADIDLLEEDIRGTRQIQYVVRGGRAWNADTMVEVWPLKGRKQIIPPLNAE